jgi:hypothetical protein
MSSPLRSHTPLARAPRPLFQPQTASSLPCVHSMLGTSPRRKSTTARSPSCVGDAQPSPVLTSFHIPATSPTLVHKSRLLQLPSLLVRYPTFY